MKNDIYILKLGRLLSAFPGHQFRVNRSSAVHIIATPWDKLRLTDRVKNPIGGLVLALSLVLLLGGASAAQAQDQNDSKPQPRLEVAESTFDAGSARAGSSVRHEFVVRNTGEGDLIILRIKPGCGCTVVNYPRIIPAGREGLVTMKVRLSEQWAGERIRQTSVMETNDPKARLTSLAVTALVAAEE